MKPNATRSKSQGDEPKSRTFVRAASNPRQRPFHRRNRKGNKRGLHSTTKDSSTITIVELEAYVEKLKQEMNDNILKAYGRGEQIDQLVEKSDDLVEQAMVFKKRTGKVQQQKWWFQRMGFVATGTAVFAVFGATAGFLVGGPAGAVVFVKVSSALAARILHATLFAVACGGGFLGGTKLP